MNSNAKNDIPAALIPQTQSSAPVTPQPSHASLPQGTTVSKVQAERVKDATGSISLTPPPSAQVSNNARTKSHTPTTPSDSHISTPPPSVHVLGQESMARPIGGFAHAMTSEELASAPADDLRLKVAELQAAYREAKMSAAHHRLQYQMLAQESAAAIERMAVEARMVQCENEVIHVAEQAKATSIAPMLPSPVQDGTIPVQKDLYHRMCRDIQQLSEMNDFLEVEHRQQEKLIFRQDNEIAGLSDKVMMLRDRIREHRDHQTRIRSASIGGYLESAPQSVLSTPRRPHMTGRDQSQPFAALLQASAMAREEVGTGKPTANRGMGKKGHSRNAQSLSSLPATPNRARKQPPLFQTPQADLHFRAMPSTAPVPRTSNLRGPGAYSQPKPTLKRMRDAGSDGTVSASDNDDDEHDSEAETEILEPDQIDESRASFSAARMLRANPEPEEEHTFQPAKRGAHGSMRQSQLFGAVIKPNVDGPPVKKPRTLQGIGLGIKGASHR